MKQKETTSLKRSLKLSHVVILGLGYLTPMTVFDTFGIVSQETGGHVPMAYLLALVAMLFTASSYGKMVKEFPVAGSAYSYTRNTINPHVGFLVGWLSLLDYLFLPMINVLLTKIYGSAAFPEVPGWMWVVGATLILTLINIMGANITANFNSLLVLFQVCVTVIFVILAYRAVAGGLGTGEVVTAAPFVSPTMSFSTLMTGASLLCFSFLGFDAVSTFTEEAIEPKKTIPRGIFLTALIGGLIFITASYFGTAAFPDVSIFENPEAPSPEIAAALGGAFFKAIFLAGALVASIASGLASLTSTSRLLYAMGRENVLPKRLFGYVSPRFRTPVVNIIVVGIFCMSALFLKLEQAISFINFGALIAFTFVNLCVITHFIIRKKMRGPKAMFNYLLSPLVGASFVGYLWYNLDMHSLTLGLIWAALGILYLVITTRGFKKKPPVIDFEEAV